MMKTIKDKYFLSPCSCVLACMMSLVLMASLTNGQVVLVQSKLRPSRAAGKTKSKVKGKPQESAEPITETVAEALPSAEPAPEHLNFAVIPPSLKTAVVESPRKPVAAWPDMLGYEFEVIKTDDHGHPRERRKERARFYLETLTGGVNLEMVEIPAGMFSMGSSDLDLAHATENYLRNPSKEIRQELETRLQVETPQRTVKVAGFYLGKYEVTQAQWRAVASLPKVHYELMSDPSYFKGGSRPVEQVSWEEAVEFCDRLSAATGRRYRLPTEAEWEYASRAGTNWPFSFGETVTQEFVNYNGKLPYGQASKDSYRQQTVAAGSLGIANAFGLYDTHGNVWEWCLDSWHDSYLGAPLDGAAWEAEGAKDLRVLRGGAWDSPAGECRSSERRQSTITTRSNNIGFRVVAEMNVTPTTR